MDSIESQIYSNQDYELDIGTGQHIPDHSDESGQEAAQSMVPLLSPSTRGAAQKSICEEVNEADDSPGAGSPLCGTAVARRPVRSAASKGTGKTKGKPIISVSIRAPRMRDMNKSSAPSTNIPTKLPFQASEEGSDVQ